MICLWNSTIFNFAILASCLQDAGKGREQERKLWREFFFLDYCRRSHHAE